MKIWHFICFQEKVYIFSDFEKRRKRILNEVQPQDGEFYLQCLSFSPSTAKQAKSIHFYILKPHTSMKKGPVTIIFEHFLLASESKWRKPQTDFGMMLPRQRLWTNDGLKFKASCEKYKGHEVVNMPRKGQPHTSICFDCPETGRSHSVLWFSCVHKS